MSKENLAFRHEYLKDIPFSELYKDIESYLGEYRFGLQRYDYQISFSNGSGEKPHLRDIFRGETMAAKAMRSVADRENAGQDASYERAELTGILSLEDQLLETQIGDTVLWISPERPEAEYGNYGFWYVGAVKEDPNDSKNKVIHFSALKVDEPTIEQFNQALSFFTQSTVEFETPEEFLSNPGIVKANKAFVMKFIENYFDFELDYSPDSTQQNLFRQKMARLMPLIKKYYSATSQSALEDESKRIFNAIENFAEKLRENADETYSTTDLAIAAYGAHDPRPVAGSCGVSSFHKSPFDSLRSKEKGWTYHDGECVVCNQKTQVGPCDICKTCEKKFDDSTTIESYDSNQLYAV